MSTVLPLVTDYAHDPMHFTHDLLHFGSLACGHFLNKSGLISMLQSQKLLDAICDGNYYSNSNPEQMSIIQAKGASFRCQPSSSSPSCALREYYRITFPDEPLVRTHDNSHLHLLFKERQMQSKKRNRDNELQKQKMQLISSASASSTSTKKQKKQILSPHPGHSKLRRIGGKDPIPIPGYI